MKTVVPWSRHSHLRYLIVLKIWWPKMVLTVMERFCFRFTGVVMPRARITVSQSLLLDHLHLKGHSCLIDEFVHVRSQTLICEASWVAGAGFFGCVGDLIGTGSRIFIFFLSEPLRSIFGPVDYTALFFPDQVRWSLNIVAARAVIPLLYGPIDKHRMHDFCIFGIREDDPDKIAIVADRVNLPPVVGWLQHTHLLPCLAHCLLVKLFLYLALLRLWSVFARLVLVDQSYSHLVLLRVGTSSRFCFESLDLRAKTAGHSHLFVYLQLSLMFGIVAPRSSVGWLDIEGRGFEGRTIERSESFVLFLFVELSVLPRTRGSLVIVQTGMFASFAKDKGHKYIYRYTPITSVLLFPILL